MDRGRFAPHREKPHWLDLKEYAKAIQNSYRKDFWKYQKHRVVVISEKATVAGILRPVLEEHGVPFMAVHGFNSATKVNELAQEIDSDERTHVFLYIGDYDCSGMYMSEKDLPGRLAEYAMDEFVFKRIALIKSDADNLPSFEAKRTDPRYRWYVAGYGEKAWELDAMDPNMLRDRLAESIREYINPDDWNRHQLTERAEKETVRTIAERMLSAVA